MVNWDLQQIITKVRNLTGTPSNDQLSDDAITDYINTYYSFTMPFELKEQINLQPLNFSTLPNIDVYQFPSGFLTDQPMAYCDGLPCIFYQDRDIFFQDWPQQYAQDQVGAGNGVTTTFSSTAQYPPLIGGTFTITDGSQVVTDDGNGNLIGAVNPAGPNTINYVTGAFSVNFAVAPASTSTIYDTYQGYQPARPQGVLWYNNEFTFRPIPDQVYPVTMQGYINQIQFVLGSDTPLQTEWGQLIAYGATVEIFADRGDLTAYNVIYPILKRYENVALARYVQQFEASQSVPRF